MRRLADPGAAPRHAWVSVGRLRQGCRVLHGSPAWFSLYIAGFRALPVVRNLHETRAESAEGARRGPISDSGFGLIEVLVALAVLWVGVLAAVGIGIAARRQAALSSAATAQQIAARSVLERLHAPGATAAKTGVSTVTVGASVLKVETEAEWIAARLAEIRVRVEASPPAPALEIVSRLYRTPP